MHVCIHPLTPSLGRLERAAAPPPFCARRPRSNPLRLRLLPMFGVRLCVFCVCVRNTSRSVETCYQVPVNTTMYRLYNQVHFTQYRYVCRVVLFVCLYFTPSFFCFSSFFPSPFLSSFPRSVGLFVCSCTENGFDSDSLQLLCYQ